MTSFCHLKWTEFAWNLADNKVSSCCESTLIKPDDNLPWESTQIISDRVELLSGIKPASCQNCWTKEAAGMLSKRQRNEPKDIDYLTGKFPEHLMLNIHNYCNLQCVYCCKQYSSSWYKDILKNGAYNLNERYNLNQLDKIKFSVSLNDYEKLSSYNLLKSLITSPDFINVKTVNISGGEPLLNINYLSDMIDSMLSNNSDLKIYINTGLGVPDKNIDELITRYSGKLVLTLSGESTGELFNFLRYGIAWNDWIKKVERISKHFPIALNCVISVLSVKGFADYLDYMKQYNPEFIITEWLVEPDFMNIVYYPSTKDDLDVLSIHECLNTEQQTSFKNVKFSDVDMSEQLENFLTEFATRKNISIQDFLPGVSK
jgi:organic radical activating enzyme